MELSRVVAQVDRDVVSVVPFRQRVVAVVDCYVQTNGYSQKK
jgi:hypothetical protein